MNVYDILELVGAAVSGIGAVGKKVHSIREEKKSKAEAEVEKKQLETVQETITKDLSDPIAEEE